MVPSDALTTAGAGSAFPSVGRATFTSGGAERYGGADARPVKIGFCASDCSAVRRIWRRMASRFINATA